MTSHNPFRAALAQVTLATAGQYEATADVVEEREVGNLPLSKHCMSFGADPDVKPGPLTQEDRGWKPEDDER
jgi:hypothetical protein